MSNVTLQSSSQVATGGRRLAQISLGPLQTAIVSATVGVPAANVAAFTGAPLLAGRPGAQAAMLT